MMGTTTTARSQGREQRANNEEITFRSVSEARESRHEAARKRRDEQNANEGKSPMNATPNCEGTASDGRFEEDGFMSVGGIAVVPLALHDTVVCEHRRRERVLAVALAAAIIAAVCAACL